MNSRADFRRILSCAVVVVLLLSGSAQSSINKWAVEDTVQQQKLTQLTLDGGDVKTSPSDQEDGQAVLPNGADGLTEGFGSWAVECKIIDGARKCSMGQYQEDPKTGKKVIALVIYPPENGTTKIMILLPFGLSLADGVRVKIDSRFARQKALFATCIADGCLVPIAFSDASMKALTQAKSFTVTATVYGSANEPDFDIPLNGFAAAHARLMRLK